MNKNKGIWIVIIGILFIGILVTVITVSFVNRKGNAEQAYGLSETSNLEEQTAFYSGEAEEESFAFQSPYSAPVPPAEEEPLLSRSQEPGILAAPPEPEAAAGGVEAQQEAGIAVEADSAQATAPLAVGEDAEAAKPAAAEEAPAAPRTVMAEDARSKTAEPFITPLSPDSKGRRTLVETTDAAVYYQKHMAELDGQIKKMREESADSNTYSMKALADKELRMWSRELNDIYTSVSECLDTEEREELEVSQQNWIKERDLKAQTAGKKYSGGSLEGVEYTASLADSTRSRAYDLVAEYEDILSEEESQ